MHLATFRRFFAHTYFGWIRGNERELLNWTQYAPLMPDGYHADANTELMQYLYEVESVFAENTERMINISAVNKRNYGNFCSLNG